MANTPTAIRLEDRLRTMKDQTFLYHAQTVKVLSFKFDGDYCTIATSGPWITRPNIEMIKLLDEFLETDEGPGDEGQALPATVIQPAVLQSSNQLKDILMENIQKVRDNKDYIPQAAEINSQVKTLIDLAKTEIEFIRAAQRR